jgi:hypothetical protein
LSDEGLRTGKLPPDLLRGLVLARLGVRRPETLVHAAIPSGVIMGYELRAAR